MNTDNSQIIFKKVAVSEKKMLFREIAHEKLQVAVKGAESNFHLIAVQSEKDLALMCHHTADSKGVNQNQAVMLSFNFKTERYFMQTELYFEAGWAVIKIEGELFQLQRRANARVEIPDKYDATFILNQHGGKNYFIDCRLKDVSAGGFKMEMTDGPEFKIGDKAKGLFKLGNRRPIEFEIEVRFVMAKEANGKKLQIAGVQFQNIDSILESKLMSVVLDLQREIFLKYRK